LQFAGGIKEIEIFVCCQKINVQKLLIQNLTNILKILKKTLTVEGSQMFPRKFTYFSKAFDAAYFFHKVLSAFKIYELLLLGQNTYEVAVLDKLQDKEVFLPYSAGKGHTHILCWAHA